MNDRTGNKEFSLDLILTRNLIDQVAEPGADVLDQCSVSLLRFSWGNALLITCPVDNSASSELYNRLVEMAKVAHHEHGKTHIFLSQPQKKTVLRWDSESLLESPSTDHGYLFEWFEWLL